MTTETDVLNAQIADLQARIAAVQASSALQVARLNKQLTDLQAELPVA